MLHISPAEIDKFSVSSLITRTSNDVMQIQTFINLMLRISLMAPFMCLGGIIMAFNKSRSMSMIIFISIPVMIIFVFIIAKASTPVSILMQETFDRINLILREKITGIRVARAFGTEKYEEERFDLINDSYMKKAIYMNKIVNFLIPGLSLILYITMVALLAFGGYIAVNDSNGILIGDIIAVIQYVMQILMSVLMLSMVFMLYPRASVSMRRVSEVLELNFSVLEKETVEEQEQGLIGHVRFDHVSFKFPGAEEEVLKNISFESGPGEVTAIIGSTGTGKTTLLNLIPRFYDTTKGDIFINNINIKNLKLLKLREKIGYVPQKSFLFSGTITKNLLFGNHLASNDNLDEAVTTAQAYEFIMDKQEGFEYKISQGGTNVSGGQRQRLSIARAIVRDPEIYLFDDSFSALDYKTDSALRKALINKSKYATIIMVAQRVSTIINADRILVLDKGECVGIGRHDELLKNCKVYMEIVSSQNLESEGEND